MAGFKSDAEEAAFSAAYLDSDCVGPAQRAIFADGWLAGRDWWLDQMGRMLQSGAEVARRGALREAEREREQI